MPGLQVLLLIEVSQTSNLKIERLGKLYQTTKVRSKMPINVSEKLNLSYLGLCLLSISQPLLGLLIADVVLFPKGGGSWTVPTKTRALKKNKTKTKTHSHFLFPSNEGQEPDHEFN